MRGKSAILNCILFLTFTLILFSSTTYAQTKIRVGYFEGGKYPLHDQVRGEFQKQLDLTAPEGYEAVFVPEGFRSAEWDREKSKQMARQLTAQKSHDIMIAVGPWTVEDLLEAGYKRPIIALHRYDAIIEGLLDNKGRPIADNLSLGFEPNRLDADLEMISRLVKVKKLGMLYFPTSSESSLMISKARAIGQQLGFEVVTGEGFNNIGTFAFFNAVAELDSEVNVLYLPPLWGMDIFMIKEFFAQAGRQDLFVFTCEGQFLVEKGAAASNNGYTQVGPARHAASNFWQIVQGALPASLPIAYPINRGLSLNLQSAGKFAEYLPTDAINSAYIAANTEPVEYELYSLPQAIARALERNPGYLARYDALEAASHAINAARSDNLPQISLSGTAGYVDDNTVNNSPSPLDNEQYQLDLTLSQKIFSTQTKNKINSAKQKKIIEQADLDQAANDLELGVTIAYLAMLEAEETVANVIRQRQLIDQNLEIANTLAIIGERPRSDFLRWENLRTGTTRSILTAQAEYEAAKAALVTMMNLPPQTILMLSKETFTEKSFWRDYENLAAHLNTPVKRSILNANLSAIAITDNPNLRIAREQIVLGRQHFTENKISYWPEIGFQASLNLVDRLLDSPGFTEKNNTLSLAATFELPLFLGNKRHHIKNQFSSLLEASEFNRDAVSLKIARRFQALLTRFLSLANSIPLTIKSKELTREGFELIQTEYLSGKISVIDLLMATNSVNLAESDYISVRYQFYRAIAEMSRELGWSTNDSEGWFNTVFLKNLNN